MRFELISSLLVGVSLAVSASPVMAQSAELVTMYIYCNYTNKNKDMYVSDILIEYRSGATKSFDKHLIKSNLIDPPVRPNGLYAHCVASYTRERAQTGLDALIRNNSRSYNIIRTGFGGDFRAESAKV